MRSTAELNGVRVMGGKNGKRRIGKVLRAVFFPDDLRLAGYLVKRPDLLFMIKRSDRFLAWDSFRVIDGRVVAYADQGSWDGQARRRLGLNWEKALIIEGMDLLDAAGERLGRIDALEYDEASGQVQALLISHGAGAKTFVGQMRVPAADIGGQKGEAMVLRADAELPDLQGGLATKAGEQAAIVSNVVKTQVDKVEAAVGGLAEKAGQGVEQAGYQAGKAIGSARRKVAEASSQAEDGADSLVESGSKAVGRQIGKTRGMFKSFSDEYKKASRG